jgi:hypothetical protein
LTPLGIHLFFFCQDLIVFRNKNKFKKRKNNMQEYNNEDNQIVAEYHISSYFDVPEDIAECLSRCNKWYIKYDTLYIQLRHEGVNGDEGAWLEYEGTTEGFDFKRPTEIIQGDRLLENGDDHSEYKQANIPDLEYEARFAAKVKAKDLESPAIGTEDTYHDRRWSDKNLDQEQLVWIEDTLLEVIDQVKNSSRLSSRNVDAIQKVLFNVNNALGALEYPDTKPV